jgi:hypothetical protein
MATSTDYKLRRLSADEILPDFWFICSRGKITIGEHVGRHEVKPTFEFSFNYVTGGGRQARRTFRLCDKHAREVAQKYKLALPEPGSNELVSIEQGRLCELFELERQVKE